MPADPSQTTSTSTPDAAAISRHFEDPRFFFEMEKDIVEFIQSNDYKTLDDEVIGVTRAFFGKSLTLSLIVQFMQQASDSWEEVRKAIEEGKITSPSAMYDTVGRFIGKIQDIIPKAIQPMLSAQGLDPDEILKRVIASPTPQNIFVDMCFMTILYKHFIIGAYDDALKNEEEEEGEEPKEE